MKRTITTIRRTGLVCGLAMLLLGLAAGPALATPTNWYVSITYGNDTGYSGTNWAQPFATLSNACAHVHSGDSIIVSNGIYNVSSTTLVQSVANVTITGFTGNATDVQVVGNGANRCRAQNRMMILNHMPPALPAGLK